MPAGLVISAEHEWLTSSPLTLFSVQLSCLQVRDFDEKVSVLLQSRARSRHF